MSRPTLATLVLTIVTLLAFSPDVRAQQYWNGTNIDNPNPPITGGTGTWTDGADTNWTNQSGTDNEKWGDGAGTGTIAIFTVANPLSNATGTYTVTLVGSRNAAKISATELVFQAGGYNFIAPNSGSSINMSDSNIVEVDQGAATFNTILTSTIDVLNKTGAGQMVLLQDNNINAGVTLVNGSILVSTDAPGALGGAASPLVLDTAAGTQNYLQITGVGNLSGNLFGNSVTVSGDGQILVVSDRGAPGAGAENDFGTLSLNNNSLVSQNNFLSNSGTSTLGFGATTIAGANAGIGSIALFNNNFSSSTNQVVLASVTGSSTNFIVSGNGNTTITGTASLGSGNLVKFGSGTLTLNGSVTTTGSIIITQDTTGNVALTGSASLNSQNILVNGGSLTVLGTGTSVFFSPTANITLAGGSLIAGLTSAAQSNFLGTLNLGVGYSTIGTSNGYTTPQVFVFNNLGSRVEGSTINFLSADRTYPYGQNGAVQIINAPTLVNGIIGGWAVTGSNNFATMSGTDVISATPTVTSTSDFSGTAGATDNVELDITNTSDLVTMGANSTINSLKVTDVVGNGLGIFNLGGNTLTLGSGGLNVNSGNNNVSYHIIDGNLTAGTTSAPAEVFINGSNTSGLEIDLGANVTDNAAGGSVSLVIDANSNNVVHLSGLNTYTGNTYLATGQPVYFLTDRQFGAEPTSLNASDITLSNGTNLVFHDYVPDALSANRGIVVTGGGGAISVGQGVGSGALEMPISGVGAMSFVSQSSAQLTTIAGNSTYDGVTTIDGGNSSYAFTSIGNINGGASSLGDPTTAANGRIILLGVNEGLYYVGTGASTTDRQFEFDTYNGGDGSLTFDGAQALTLNGNLLINASGNGLYLNGYGIGIINGNILQTQANPSQLFVGSGYAPAAGGIIELNGENTFSGQITVLRGNVLEFNTVGNVGSGPSSLGAPTDVSDGTINLQSATLRFNGTTAQSTDRVINLNGDSGLETIGSAPITFIGGVQTNNHTLTLGGSGQGFLSGAGIVSGGGGLTMQGISGQGTWTLNQNTVNTYTGMTILNSGNLVLDFSNLSTPTNLINASSQLMLDGGSLTIQGASGQIVSQTFNGMQFGWYNGFGYNNGSLITLDATNAASVSLNVGAINNNFGGSDGRTLDIETIGNATMYANNIPSAQASGLVPYITFNGNNFATLVGTTVTAFTNYTGSLTSSTTGNNGNSYNLIGGLTMDANLNGSGNKFFNLSALKVAADANGETLDLNGNTFNSNGQTGLLYDGTANNYSYTISDGAISANFVELDVEVASGTLTISATLNVDNNDFVKAGKGTLIISGNNAGYTSNTFVNYGTLAAGSNTAFSNVSYVDVSAAGVLATNGYNVSFLGANGLGTIQNGSSTASTLSLGAGNNGVGGRNYTQYYNGSTFFGIIQDGGSGSLSLVKDGLGYQVLAESYDAMNTYSGSTTVLAGYLDIDLITDSGTASSLGTGSQINLGSAGQMGDLQFSTALTANQESNRSITLAAGGVGALDVVGSGGVLGGSTTGEGTANGDLYGALVTLSGNIDGAGTLLKLGLGNLDLSGTNTYTGGTVVDYGMLRFDTPDSVPASGLITVNSGGAVGTQYAINQAFLNQINSASTGVVALGSDSSNNLDFSNLGSVALGALGHYVFSGSLTPNSAAGYQLGGGGIDGIYETTYNPAGPNSVLFIANANTITGNHNVTVSPHGSSGASVVFDDTQNFTGTLTVEGGINANQIYYSGLYSNDYPHDGNPYNPGWMAAATLTLAGGQLPNVNGIILNPLGNLTVVVGSNTTNILPSTLPITFNGGGLAFENDSTQYSASGNLAQSIGTIDLNRGASEIYTQTAQNSFTSTVTIASINRAAGATITFAGNIFGKNTNISDPTTVVGGGNQNEVVVTNTGTLSTTLATPWAFVGGGAAYGAQDDATDFAIISNTGSGTFGSVRAANGAVVSSASSIAGGDYTFDNSTALSLSGNVAANTIRVTSSSNPTIAMNGHTLAVNGIMNVGQNGSQLTIGNSVGDGNLTAESGVNELVMNPAHGSANSASDIIVNSNIVDNNTSLTLVKTGIGDVTLNGNNTFSGGIVEEGVGSLVFNSSSAFGSGAITLNSGAVVFGSGISSATTITNNWVVNADAAMVDTDSGASGLTLTGSIAINGAGTTLYWVSSANQSRYIDSAISGSGNLTLQGNATAITLGGAASNTYTGLTSITGRPDGSSQTIVSLEKTGTATAIAGNILLGSESVAFNGPANSNGYYNVAQEVLVLNQGNVANWSANNIASTSVITFQGGNGYDAGVFELNNNNQTLGGIQSSVTGDGIIENNATLANNTSVLTVNATGTSSYSYSGIIRDHDTSYGNEGNVAVVKSGTGSQSLGNANTYTGGTTVTAGSLYANNTTGSATGSGSVTVASGATIGGTGIINSTSNVINGNVAVGQGFAGDLNTTKILTMTASVATTFSGANLTFDLSTTGGGNQLALGATPSVLFNGASNSLTFDLQGAGIITTGSTYVLFTSTGAGSGLDGSIFGGDGISLSGTTNVIDGIALNFNTNGLAHYNGSTLVLVNNGPGLGYNIDLDIAAVAAPEPGTWALMLGGVALLLVYQRSRRSKNDI